MIISPHYEVIKARAIALLTAAAGFNGFTADEVMSLGKWGTNNNIGVALCKARDAIEPVTTRPRRGFNTGNFRKAEREIAKYMKECKRQALK